MEQGGQPYPLVLLPPGYTTMEAQIEITIDGAGNFIAAHLVDKSDAETIVPAPEGRTSGLKALPLFDKLIYIAGDYRDYVVADTEKALECHKLYIEELSSWCNSAYSHPKVCAIFKYVSQGTMISDLIKSRNIANGFQGKGFRQRKIQSIDQADVFIRFRVLYGRRSRCRYSGRF